MKDPQDSAGAYQDARSGSTGRLVEVLVFLFLIVPSMFFSFFAMRQAAFGFVFAASSAIARDLSLLCLVFFFAWRNGEAFSLFGWRGKNLRRDALIGIALFMPFTYGIAVVEGTLKGMGLSAPGSVPSFLLPAGKAQTALAFMLAAAAAFAEEGIFRGYLIRRFNPITGSPAAAVVISSIIFSLGHGYEGTAGVVTVAITGIVLSMIYLWRESLTAPIVMHFLQDFMSIILSRYLLK